MIVIGGRALGLEFAQMYARFGTKVTLLQRSDRIIPDHEPEISDTLRHLISMDDRIDIVTGVQVDQVYQKDRSKYVKASVDTGKKVLVFEAEQLLMATGRRPNTAVAFGKCWHQNKKRRGYHS